MWYNTDKRKEEKQRQLDEEYKAQKDILSAEYWDNRDALDAKLIWQLNNLGKGGEK